jgi:hypothetical protein
MPKVNRGDTTKLSIKLSTLAKQNIEKAALNLNLSKGGVIVFALAKIFKNPPSKSDILNLENKIDLEPKHFVLTINEQLSSRITQMSKDYEMKKNVMIGLLVSNHFENLSEVKKEILMKTEDRDMTPRSLQVLVNESLKKKINEYSEGHYVPWNGIISYAVLGGPYEGLPEYDTNEGTAFFTSVPTYIGELVKKGAAEMGIREHFYVSLCLYKAFMTEEGILHD